jgi:hypothetical protein
LVWMWWIIGMEPWGVLLCQWFPPLMRLNLECRSSIFTEPQFDTIFGEHHGNSSTLIKGPNGFNGSGIMPASVV